MISIRADRSSCQGYGNCVLAEPSVFALDEEGLVVLTEDSVGEDREAGVRRAAYDCPTEAISVAQSNDA